MKLLDENGVISLAKWTIEMAERFDEWGKSIDTWRQETSERIDAMNERLTALEGERDPGFAWRIELMKRIMTIEERITALEPQLAPQAAEEKPYEFVFCPACGTVLAWDKHNFSDPPRYKCYSARCSMSDFIFTPETTKDEAAAIVRRMGRQIRTQEIK